MPNTKGTLLASSDSIESVKKLIRSYFFMKDDAEISMTPTGKGFTVSRGDKPLSVYVIKCRGRFQLRSIA